MGREFITLFDDWAVTYDQSVAGNDPEYSAVFANYEGILYEVARNSNGAVLEFGVGTGNLSKKLMEAEHQVIGIEPSAAMRKIAKSKFPELLLLAGDFITFPELPSPVETIASTYAFHHLTDDEKEQAIKKFAVILPDNGRIVFADTMFQSEADKQTMIEKAEDRGFDALATDLKTEYYPVVNNMKQLFERYNFQVTCKQMNEFVWLIMAEKVKHEIKGETDGDL